MGILDRDYARHGGLPPRPARRLPKSLHRNRLSLATAFTTRHVDWRVPMSYEKRKSGPAIAFGLIWRLAVYAAIAVVLVNAAVFLSAFGYHLKEGAAERQTEAMMAADDIRVVWGCLRTPELVLDFIRRTPGPTAPLPECSW